MSEFTALETTLELIEKKDFKIYFFTIDFGDYYTPSVDYLYNSALSLKKSGYDTVILYQAKEGEEYKNLKWLSKECSELEHVPITQEGLELKSADVILIPERHPVLMESLKSVPCHKIVLCQQYSKIFNIENPFELNWYNNYKINDCITTSDQQTKYVGELFPSMNVKTVQPYVSKKETVNLKKPIIALYSDSDIDTNELVSKFYLKYPYYKWISFKNMKNLSKEDFSKELGDCCVAIYIDSNSNYESFPLECFSLKIPVIGLMNQMLPQYMSEGDMLNNNGIWLRSKHNLHTVLAEFMTMYLQDTLPDELYETEKYYTELTKDSFDKNIYKVMTELIETRKNQIQTALNNKEKLTVEA